MLFGVPDGITDVTRVSGMVRKRRLIYRMTSFDYRKVFGVTGNVPGMTNGFREFTGGGGATHPGEAHRPWGVAHQPLVGWWDSPKGPYAPYKGKSKRKKGGGKEGKDSLPPNQVQLGLGGGVLPPWLGRPLGSPLDPKARSPSLLLYMGGF